METTERIKIKVNQDAIRLGIVKRRIVDQTNSAEVNLLARAELIISELRRFIDGGGINGGEKLPDLGAHLEMLKAHETLAITGRNLADFMGWPL